MKDRKRECFFYYLPKKKEKNIQNVFVFIELNLFYLHFSFHFQVMLVTPFKNINIIAEFYIFKYAEYAKFK